MTIVADAVALRTVVQEWARVGGVRLVNPQHVSLAPVSILLQNVPEGEALKILLRSLPGYVLQKRSIESGGPSVFQQLAVMAPAVGSAQTPTLSMGGLAAQAEAVDQEPAEAPYDPSSPPAGMAPAAEGAFAQPQGPSATGARTPPPPVPSAIPGQARPGLPAPLRGVPGRNTRPERP
jgi:hypothetical protein